MKTTVIGGNGFIGKAVVSELLELGRDITVVGRRPKPADLTTEVKYLQFDCFTTTALATLLKGSNEIIDFSYTTTPKTSFDDPLTDLTSNLPRAISIFEASKSVKALERLIVVSSGGTVYGNTDSFPITESTPTHPISPYGITKLTIEKYAHLYEQLYNLPVIIVRPANAYGPKTTINESQGFINVCFSKILKKEVITVFGDKGTVRDYIYISDLADAFVKVLQSGSIGKTYNIGTGLGINNIELLDVISTVVIPNKFENRYSISPVRPFDVPMNVLDYSLLNNDTGWQPTTDLQTGLMKTWNWMLDKVR